MMAKDMEDKLQLEIDKVDGMEARNNDCISKIESNYDEDGNKELKDNIIQQLVLTGTTPTAIVCRLYSTFWPANNIDMRKV